MLNHVEIILKKCEFFFKIQMIQILIYFEIIINKNQRKLKLEKFEIRKDFIKIFIKNNYPRQCFHHNLDVFTRQKYFLNFKTFAKKTHVPLK